MVYLDYSATTPVNKEVLNSFNKTCLEYYGNSNSLHELGVKARKLEESATEQIKKILNLSNVDIIYTSGSSESNNTAIKGICDKYSNRGKHIITSPLEHSSINEPLKYLEKKGYKIDVLNVIDGVIDLEDLKSKLTKDTILVTICSVNSETGIKQPVEKIGKILKNYSCFFHVDATQSIGKIKIDFSDVDLISFSAHKFYGLKGIGCLIKKDKILLEPLIHGGKSTTKYRSGTPALPLIVSLSKSLRLINEKIDNNYTYVEELNRKIKNKLLEYDNVRINSNNNSIPHILNISVLHTKPETLQHALETKGIYISTQSACSSSNSTSNAVLKVTNDLERANHSVRISLSGLTSEEDIDKFLIAFDECYNELKFRD